MKVEVGDLTELIIEMKAELARNGESINNIKENIIIMMNNEQNCLSKIHNSIENHDKRIRVLEGFRIKVWTIFSIFTGIVAMFASFLTKKAP